MNRRRIASAACEILDQDLVSAVNQVSVCQKKMLGYKDSKALRDNHSFGLDHQSEYRALRPMRDQSRGQYYAKYDAEATCCHGLPYLGR